MSTDGTAFSFKWGFLYFLLNLSMFSASGTQSSGKKCSEHILVFSLTLKLARCTQNKRMKLVINKILGGLFLKLAMVKSTYIRIKNNTPIYPEYTPFIPLVQSEHSPSIPRVYLEYTPSIPRVYPEYTPSIPRVYPLYTLSIPRVFI